MIKGIFFDAAGILYQRMSPTADFAEELAKKKNYSGVPSKQERQDLESMRVHASQGQFSHEEYWQQFLLLHGVKNTRQQKRMIKQIIDYSNDVFPVPGCREALAALKHRNFILGIITDTIYPLEWKMMRLAKAGVSGYIDVVACSTDLGLHKPDPAIYLNALQQVNLVPSESAFVGHDASEIRGAHQAGMVTVAVNFEHGVHADYYCLSMLDLLEIPELLICG